MARHGKAWHGEARLGKARFPTFNSREDDMDNTIQTRTIDHLSGKSVVPSRSPETSMLIAHLKHLPVGSEVSYEELGKIIRKDPQQSGRTYLDSARRYLLNHHQQPWCTIRKCGIKLLCDVEALTWGEEILTRSRRTSRKAGKVAKTIDYGKLDDNGRRKHNALIMADNIVQMFTKKQGLFKLGEKMEIQNTSILPETCNVLSMFVKP